jgi:hypothetical protein
MQVSPASAIINSLMNNEAGDARSQLDEHYPTGDFSLAELDAANSNFEWSWDSHDGWSYEEVSN